VSKKRTVFVVTAGDYSDYRLEALFSTQALAEAWLEEKRQCEWGLDSPQIDEWVVDEEAGMVATPVFIAQIQLASGDLYPGTGKELFRPKERARVYWYTAAPAVEHRTVRALSAVSAEHAAKVAVEKRQAWLREPERYNGRTGLEEAP
jgi:hypothetical protein